MYHTLTLLILGCIFRPSYQDGTAVIFATRKDDWQENLEFDYGMDDVKALLTALDEKMKKLNQVESLLLNLQAKWMPFNDRLDEIILRLEKLEKNVCQDENKSDSREEDGEAEDDEDDAPRGTRPLEDRETPDEEEEEDSASRSKEIEDEDNPDQKLFLSRSESEKVGNTLPPPYDTTNRIQCVDRRHFEVLVEHVNTSCGRLEIMEIELRNYWKNGMANYRALWDKMAGIEFEVSDMRNKFQALQLSVDDAVSEANLERLDYQREFLKDQKHTMESAVAAIRDIGMSVISSYNALNDTIMEVVRKDTEIISSVQTLTQVVIENATCASESQAKQPNNTESNLQSDSTAESNVTQNLITNCAQLLEQGKHDSGIYSVWPDEKREVQVYCDMTSDGGGWLVIQRRGNFGPPTVNFNREWDSYKEGFGNLEGEFWIGNDLLHLLTTKEPMSLRIELEDANGNTKYAIYDTFRVDDESRNYRLHVGSFRGNAGDSLSKHNLQQFTTHDRDNDKRKSLNCAKLYKGGWWYDGCGYAKLNGIYYSNPKKARTGQGIIWFTWKGWTHSLKFAEMKIRPNKFVLLNNTRNP